MAPSPYLSMATALFAPEQTPILSHLYYKGSHQYSFILCILLAVSGLLVVGIAIGFITYTYRHYDDYAEYMPKKPQATGTATTTVNSEERQVLSKSSKDNFVV